MTETRFARYNRDNADVRRKYEENTRRDRRHIDRARMQKTRGIAKNFIVWDGEGSRVPNGEPQPYILFGYVDGNGGCRYAKDEKLKTAQCLNLICDSPKDAIHFGFAFGYDVNQILCDLSYGHLKVLAKLNRVRWAGFTIEYIPGKWFRVHRTMDKATRKIYDVFSYFNCALVTDDPDKPGALDTYKIGTPAERKYLAEQKANRPDFTWEEVGEVLKYWKLEGRLMVELMEYVRKIFNEAGFYPTSWHGPGALARIMLKNHGIDKCKLNTPKNYPEVWEASRYAFTGGRFQQWLAGFYDGMVYNYDIHSAYPYAIQFLPNLATGKFCHNKTVDRKGIKAERFCVYHIRYDADKLKEKGSYFHKCRPRPLFRRLKNDAVYWPDQVEGWYWSPEAELVKDDPAAEFIEAWEFTSDGTLPLAFIADVYAKREYHKALLNAIEYGFKLAMNSCYGQFAQRAGWQNQRPPGPPPFHQLEYAGYITSMCKAMVHKVATYAYDKGGLITIDTDGIFTTVQIPDDILPNGIGDGLGQWEEQKYQAMLIWQNGFYWLKKNGEWTKARSRGAPRGKVPIDAAWDALDYMDPIQYDKMQFIGFKLAINQFGLKWRSWTPVPHKVAFGGGSGSKMQHRGPTGKELVTLYRERKSRSGQCRTCSRTWDHSMHTLHPMDVSYKEYHGDILDIWSYKHNLPWLEDDDRTADFIEDEELMNIYMKMSL